MLRGNLSDPYFPGCCAEICLTPIFLFYDAKYTLLVIGVGHGQLGLNVGADGVHTPRTTNK